jgi:putrescine aminotransferase
VPQSLDDALTYADRWVGLIHQASVPEALGKQIIEESKLNFAEYFNRGWLEYRKSVTEAGDWAATEWTGSGALFRDVLGREYIDCLGGYGLLVHGWANPEIVDTVRAQLTLRTPMPSQELIDPLRGVLARLMAHITPGDIKYSFFCASGTEAIEGAIKLAKLYTRKNGFIVAVKAFHGKTMGSLSMMGKADYRQPAWILYGGPVYHVPFGEADAVERQLEICRTVGIDIAGVLMEPIQGEAGAIVPPDDYWPRLRELTRHYGVLLIADEVQTGMGRTGKLWGVDHWKVVPDILASAKALGGGVMPISAFCSTEEIWQVMMQPNPFIHTTTTGGGALACSIAAIQFTREAVGNGRQGPCSQRRPPGIGDLHSDHRRGLLIRMHFHNPEIGYKVAAGLFQRGVLVGTAQCTHRVEPPLVILRGAGPGDRSPVRHAGGVEQGMDSCRGGRSLRTNLRVSQVGRAEASDPVRGPAWARRVSPGEGREDLARQEHRHAAPGVGRDAAGGALQLPLLGRGHHALCSEGQGRLLVGCGWEPVHRLPARVRTDRSQACLRRVDAGACRDRRELLFAMTSELEVAVAEKIVAMCPAVEMVRFACSGPGDDARCASPRRTPAREDPQIRGQLPRLSGLPALLNLCSVGSLRQPAQPDPRAGQFGPAELPALAGRHPAVQ